MRKTYAALLTAGLLVLAASPAFAQPGRGMFEPNKAMLLGNKSVQEELKLTDDQVAKLDKFRDKYKDDFDKARKDMDFKKIGELMKTVNDDVVKALPDVLKPDQVKRLNQIEVQVAGLNAFAKEDVQTALKLTDKQKKEIDETKADIEKDAKDLMDNAGEDRDKRRAAREKVQTMRKDAMDKIVKTLSDDQAKTYKDLAGEKFDIKWEFRRPPAPTDK